jgi:hypothetical protein
MFVPLLMGCPFGEEKCPFNDWERITNIDNLLMITPLMDTFKLGDEVLVEVAIADSVKIGDEIINLLSETGDLEPLILISQRVDNLNLFDNTMTLVHGEKNSDLDWFYLEYLLDKRMYSLKINIEFLKPGSYSLFAKEARIIFGNQEDCNWYEIRTSLNGVSDEEFFYEFTVVP